MRPTGNNSRAGAAVFAAALLALGALDSKPAMADQSSSDIALWNSYVSMQKGAALEGFGACYSVLASRRDLTNATDLDAAARAIDQSIKRGGGFMPYLVMKALKEAPPNRTEIPLGAEVHTDDEWWQALDDDYREPFAHGVLWCEMELHRDAPDREDVAVKRIVRAMNRFYDVDAHWKGRRAKARIDVPYAVALKLSGALKATEGRGPALRLSPH